MMIQVRRFEVKSGNSEELCKQASDALSPVLQKIPGFIDYSVVNGTDGYIFSVTVFQDKVGLDQAFQKVHEWTEKMTQGRLGPPEIFQGEIVYSASEQKKSAA